MTPDILSPEFSENPFPVLELMRDEYPVYFHEAWRADGHVDFVQQ